ncbi:DUF397 domain-containing protein [Streptomyces sp. NBC_01803]|nr:DUF397 domain-containing protein [Streptomyces sp. NBC_01803]WSA46798.1 DUF397 domain-containing protein [Streptomyces sp. NBC_01803]
MEVGSDVPVSVPVRDSETPARAVLSVPTRSWAAFVASLQS